MDAVLVKAEVDKYFLFSENAQGRQIQLFYRLSISNCIAVENGYDLEDIIENNTNEYITTNIRKFNYGFEKGFQKALELRGDKTFSQNDLIKAIEMAREGIVVTRVSEWETEKEFEYNENQIIQSIQKSNWNVIIETEDSFEKNGEAYTDEVGNGQYSTHSKKPKLDSQGCVILKRK